MKQRNKILNAIFFLVLFVPCISYSDDQSNGCGLGWSVTEKHSLLATTVRSFVERLVSGSAQTFGMTSGTSNCERHSIVKADKRGLHYADANYEQLRVEMAQGSGEYLTSFAAVLGCSPEAYSDFSAMIQSQYPNVFNSETKNPKVLLNDVKIRIQKNQKLSKNCQASA
jgi:hypothetical protein